MIPNRKKFFIFKALRDSYINYDEFVSAKTLLREYYEMEKEIKNSENAVEYTI